MPPPTHITSDDLSDTDGASSYLAVLRTFDEDTVDEGGACTFVEVVASSVWGTEVQQEDVQEAF